MSRKRWVITEDRSDTVITPHQDYLQLGRDEEERRKYYRALFDARMDPEAVDEIRRATNGNYALGSNRFQEEIARMLKRRAAPGKPGRRAKN